MAWKMSMHAMDKKGRRGTHPGGQAEQLQNTPAV
jgi:hypothetical protein